MKTEKVPLESGIRDLITTLYPICRSITGDGVRETLRIMKNIIPLEIVEIPTGTKVFDWEVPREWNIRDAYIKDLKGNKIVDFKDSNLHVVNYSIPVDKIIPFSELKNHLHTLPEYPDWIPYRTSYYKETWGFCVQDSRVKSMKDEEYEVKIDSTLAEGHLTYGELYIPGSIKDEVLFSCHVCHPSLANDNLSGIAVMTYLARHLMTLKLHYSYRFLFVPGTIGSIVWLASNQDKLKNVKHGLIAVNLGDPGKINFKKTRLGNAEIDRAVEAILRDSGQPYGLIDFFPYGYDERQYNSPGINLPVGCIMRTPHNQFPEYHTSADNLDFIRAESLMDSYHKILNIVDLLESNRTYFNTQPYCEPQLGKRGLYRHIGGSNATVDQMALLWVLNLADGFHSLLDIAERSGESYESLKKAADLLLQHDLLEVRDGESRSKGIQV